MENISGVPKSNKIADKKSVTDPNRTELTYKKAVTYSEVLKNIWEGVKNMPGSIIEEIKNVKSYLIIVCSVILVSYSVFLYLDADIIVTIGAEDNLFEWLTAIGFLISSVIFFLTFRKTKNYLLLILSVILFVGFGEEISWGQRLFKIETPETIKKINVQQEINIHNLEIFNDQNLEGIKKKGILRLVEINMLYRIFSVTYLICIPFFFYVFKRRPIKNVKFRIPVAPVSIGIFYFISWAVFYSIKYVFIPDGTVAEYYKTPGEIFEFTSAFIYLIISLYFYRSKEAFYLGQEIRQSQQSD